MPIYPPRNNAVRKKEIFEYKIYELIKGVEKKYSDKKLYELSEKVRIAKLNFIKAELHLMKSYSEGGYKISDIKKIENLDYKIMRWQSLNHKEIIKEAKEMNS